MVLCLLLLCHLAAILLPDFCLYESILIVCYSVDSA